MDKNKIKVAISSDFLKSFSQIPQKQQSKVREFVEKFRAHPTSSGIHYEKIHQAKDSNLYSIRIDQTYRGIVLKPKEGNVYMLLWVDHHDKAYQWAENRIFQIHPATGSLQVVNVQQQVMEAEEKVDETSKKDLFAQFKDKQLVRLGIPNIILPLVRTLQTEEELDQAEELMPQEAYEALFMLAAGYSMEEVYLEMEKRELDEEIDPDNFAAALENPDSKRRFHVVDDALELAEILKSPLELWRVFLHPTQRKMVEIRANGPVRILGGAGTGKTVVAMHRTKWLAQNVFTGENDRILFTTFTRNLAEDIGENLRKICSLDLLKKIDVMNLDAWTSHFLKKNGYEYTIIFDEDIGPLWENALNQVPEEMNLPGSFYRDEWEMVIQAQGISSCTEYMKAARIGRGRRLSRIERKKVWPVFEEYRVQLNEHNRKEMVDAIRDARIILKNKGDTLPYKAIIVDEAQDMGMEAFKLIRQMVPEERPNHHNDIFIVGDAHQRIYRYKVILSQCGVNIRGRGRRLKINYRTTEETRSWAVKLLEGRPLDDLDGGRDSQKGYKSLLHGAPPQVVNFVSFSDEIQWILTYLNKLEDEKIPLNSVCLIARTRNLLLQYEGAIKAAGLQTYFIKRSVPEDRKSPGLRLATMHRVKGLEFDHMIIAGVNDGIVPLSYALMGKDNPFAEEESETRERALLYVSATRAKKDVLITSHGNKSRFL